VIIENMQDDLTSLQSVTAAMTAPGKRFELGTSVVRGQTLRVWKNAPETLNEIVHQSLNHGEREFLVYEGERVSFVEHHRLAVRLAVTLRRDFGIKEGDRVAIAMRNLPEWVISFWAILLAGAVVVPLNAWWTADELEFALTDSGSRVAFVDSARLGSLAGNVAGGVEVLIVADENRRDQVEPRPLLNAGASRVVRFEELVTTGDNSPVAAPNVQITADSDATIFYTSGTTGKPKGAVGTHRSACNGLMNQYFFIVRSLKRSAAKSGGPETNSRNVILLSVPLFHVTGCLATLLLNTWAGGTLVMMHHFDPEDVLDLIEREKITTFGGVPTMVRQVLDSPTFSNRDCSSIRSITYGGAPAPPELVRRIAEHFPSGTPGTGYGLTETSAVVAMNVGSDYLRKPESVGPAVPVCDVAIVPDGGTEPDLSSSGARNSQVGELWIRGPQVVRGYWSRPEETAEAFRDGWFRTGDIGHLDEEGFIFISDRAKDVIIRGGENIYSVEVESTLFDHEDVSDCAVIGVPHDVLGEEVGAVVVLRSGSTTNESELAAHVKQRIATYNVPTRWWFVAGPLPRNPAGKVLKRQLRDMVVDSVGEAMP
jgi:long-chain acyl-CoA synthetase